jgi:hypothetical protein
MRLAPLPWSQEGRTLFLVEERTRTIPYCTNRATALLRCCPCQGWPPLWSSSVQAILSAVLRAGQEPTAALSHLSPPDSLLMSCVAYRGLVECVVSKNIRQRSQDDSDY